MDDKTVGRFWSKVDSGQPGFEPLKCWPWTAGKFRAGYGAFWLNGKLRKAHRVMWEHLFGPIWGVRRTHCKHGHELTGVNIYENKSQRHCRTCRHERIAVWNAKLSEERRARRGQSQKAS